MICLFHCHKSVDQQFKELLILSYFKQHNDYSLVQIASNIGVSLNNLADLIEILIEKGRV